MAVNAKEGQEMVDACKKANVKLLVGYRMHFEPHTLEIIRMRKAGEFGKIMFFQGLSGFTIGDPTQWRLNKQLAGGGSHDGYWHLLDQWSALYGGRRPYLGYCTGNQDRPGKI